MKRPLLAIGTVFTVATWASFFFTELHPMSVSVFLAVVGAVLFLLWRERLRVPVILLLSASAAFASFTLYQSRNILPFQRMSAETVEITGVVMESQYNSPAIILTVRATFPQHSLPATTLRIRDYGEQEYFPGDGVRCLVVMEDLNSSQSYYNTRGIYMSSRLLEIEPFGELTSYENMLGFFIRLRSRMVSNVYSNYPRDTAGLVSGMVLGVRTSIDRSVNDALVRSGSIHLLSVSGLHLSTLTGCLSALLSRLRVTRRLRALLCAAAAVSFALLVGFSPSIIRALVMCLTVLAARLFSRRSDTLNSLGLALLLIAILAPQWTLSTGLWLSASSTAGISVLSGPMLRSIDSRFKEYGKPARYLARIFLGAAAISVSAYAFSFPILLLTSGWASAVSPLTNILIAPFTAPALIGGMICAVFPAVAAPISRISDACAEMIVSISKLTASLPLATFPLDELWMLIWLALAAVVIVLLFYFRADGNLIRYGAALLLISFAAGSVSLTAARHNTVELAVIEGCSPVVLLRENAAVVVGTPSVYEIGALTRYLSFRGITALDAVIATDCGEHIGSGLIRLVEGYSPGMLIGPDDAYILGSLEQALPSARVLSSGYAIVDVLGGVSIEDYPAAQEVCIRSGDNLIVKSGGEYGIIEDGTGSDIRVWQGGIVVWPQSAPPTYSPVGDLLFGERRIILSIDR